MDVGGDGQGRWRGGACLGTGNDQKGSIWLLGLVIGEIGFWMTRPPMSASPEKNPLFLSMVREPLAA